MSDTNEVVVSGRLTKDPELRETNSGAKVLDLYLACNQQRLSGEDEGGNPKWQERTTYLKATCWNALAERLASRAKKGDEMVVTGQLGDDNFPLKDQPGVSTTGRLKVEVRTVNFIGRREKRRQTATEGTHTEAPSA